MPVHEEVLRAACAIACQRPDWSFGIAEVVRTLPHLNESTVRTHVGSRCCVNAPANHPHKWAYFRRIARSHYRVEPKYRFKPKFTAGEQGGHARAGRASGRPQRETIHAVITRDGAVYVAECLELAVVTQGKSLDQVVENLRQALALHLEDEDMAALGLVEHPRVQLIYDMAAAS